MTWYLEGKHVKGLYLGDIPVSGTITESRVAYGGSVKHTVLLDEPIVVYGTRRETIILGSSDTFVVD